jgi:hypothetical protein
MKLALLVSACACFLSATTCSLIVCAQPPDAASTGPGFSTLPVTPRRAQKLYAAPMMNTRVELGISEALAPPKALTMADVHALLASLSLNPTSNPAGDGTTYDIVREAHGNCTFSYSVYLSTSKSNIWINCWLMTVKDPDNTKAAHWYKLMASQTTLWPAYFTYDATDQELMAHQCLPNSNVTQASLRTTIDGFLDKLVASSSLWDTSQWTDTPAPAAAPAGSK